MEDNEEMIPEQEEENDELLPDGWTGDGDFFDVKSWGGNNTGVDASEDVADNDDTETEEEFTLEKFLTTDTDTGAQESEDNTESDAATTGEAEEQKVPNKLKFRATIDHNPQDVEMDESDLPTIYQKAYATDRAQEKLAKLTEGQKKAERVAKMLGYGSVDEMMDAAEKSYTDSEVERLTSENVHPEVARDMVERRKQHNAEMPPKAEENTPKEEAPKGRDFKQEVADMLRVYPDMKGQKLPEEVVTACVKDGIPLTQAYASYKSKQDEAEKKALRKERDTLKQNADAAARAPVRGVSKGGKTDTKPSDPFLAGFNS